MHTHINTHATLSPPSLRARRTPLLVSVAPAAHLHPTLNCWVTPLHPPQARQAATQPPLSRLLHVLGLGGYLRFGQGRAVLLLFRVVRCVRVHPVTARALLLQVHTMWSGSRTLHV